MDVLVVNEGARPASFIRTLFLSDFHLYSFPFFLCVLFSYCPLFLLGEEGRRIAKSKKRKKKPGNDGRAIQYLIPSDIKDREETIKKKFQKPSSIVAGEPR